MKTTLLKSVDRIFGTLLVRFLKKPKPSGIRSIRSVLFIRPGGIGDAVLLIPSIVTLKRYCPEATIHVLAEKRNGPIFTLCPAIDNIFLYDRPKQLMAVMSHNYDVVIDAEQWHRLSAVVARLTDASMRIGFATNERKKLFTHPLAYSHDDFEMDSFLNLLKPLSENTTYETGQLFFTLPQDVVDKAQRLLQPLSFGNIITMFPGGSINEKKWGNDKFHEAAQEFIQRGYGVVVVGGKDDILSGCEIADGLPGVLNLCGKLSLVETAAVLKETSLLITTDSGLMHIAWGLGTKILALFGPSNVKKWAPRGEGNTIIQKHLDCSPCSKFGYTPRCKRNAECMSRITVDEVVEKALELLKQN